MPSSLDKNYNMAANSALPPENRSPSALAYNAKDKSLLSDQNRGRSAFGPQGAAGAPTVSGSTSATGSGMEPTAATRQGSGSRQPNLGGNFGPEARPKMGYEAWADYTLGKQLAGREKLRSGRNGKWKGQTDEDIKTKFFASSEDAYAALSPEEKAKWESRANEDHIRTPAEKEKYAAWQKRNFGPSDRSQEMDDRTLEEEQRNQEYAAEQGNREIAGAESPAMEGRSAARSIGPIDSVSGTATAARKRKTQAALESSGFIAPPEQASAAVPQTRSATKGAAAAVPRRGKRNILEGKVTSRIGELYS